MPAYVYLAKVTWDSACMGPVAGLQLGELWPRRRNTVSSFHLEAGNSPLRGTLCICVQVSGLRRVPLESLSLRGGRFPFYLLQNCIPVIFLVHGVLQSREGSSAPGLL